MSLGEFHFNFQTPFLGRSLNLKHKNPITPKALRVQFPVWRFTLSQSWIPFFCWPGAGHLCTTCSYRWELYRSVVHFWVERLPHLIGTSPKKAAHSNSTSRRLVLCLLLKKRKPPWPCNKSGQESGLMLKPNVLFDGTHSFWFNGNPGPHNTMYTVIY